MYGVLEICRRRVYLLGYPIGYILYILSYRIYPVPPTIYANNSVNIHLM